MTDAPKRIWSERFWQNGDKWGHAGLKPESKDQEYVRADIADDMLEALKKIARGKHHALDDTRLDLMECRKIAISAVINAEEDDT